MGNVQGDQTLSNMFGDQTWDDVEVSGQTLSNMFDQQSLNPGSKQYLWKQES